MSAQEKIKIKAADGLLTGLKQLGVDYIFGNTGTDYPPIIGSLARFQQAGQIGQKVPQTIAVPHENVAVHMAYGVYLATGKPQVVMVHTNVGTANAICGLINANRAHVPMIIIAGRAPGTEAYDRTSKPGYIHWGQEMFDQAGMVRENVKWDYHISGDNIVELDLILQRAVTMATAYPPGPVYLTFAPGALEQMIELPQRMDPPVAISKPYPDPAMLSQISTWLAQAERPLVITGGTDRNRAILPALTALAEGLTVPVVTHLPRHLHFPMNHPLYLGADPHQAVPQADLIISLETDVPYMPLLARPASGCHIAEVGPDPVFQRYPRRGFPAEAYVCSDVALFLEALLQTAAKPSAALANSRKNWVSGLRETAQASRQAEVERAQHSNKMNYGWISHCIAQAVEKDTIVVLEFDMKANYLSSAQPGDYYGAPNAGGLGWGLGTALGVRLAEPERTVITMTGDGCYYFGNPTAAHSVARVQGLPFLAIVFNNAKWATVVHFTNRWYPEMEEETLPLTGLGPQPDFEKIAEIFGGYGERVEHAQDLPGALERALYQVRVNRRQALLNLIVA